MDPYLRYMLNEALRQQNDAIVLVIFCPGCHHIRQLRRHKGVCKCLEHGTMFSRLSARTCAGELLAVRLNILAGDGS